MRGIRARPAAALLSLALASGLSACSGDGADDSPDGPASGSHASGDGSASLGVTEAELLDSDAEVRIAPAALTTPQADDLKDALDIGGLVGPTLQITVEGEELDGELKLTRHYPAPLPDDAVATFAYYDDELRRVARRTLRAVGGPHVGHRHRRPPLVVDRHRWRHCRRPGRRWQRVRRSRAGRDGRRGAGPPGGLPGGRVGGRLGLLRRWEDLRHSGSTHPRAPTHCRPGWRAPSRSPWTRTTRSCGAPGATGSTLSCSP